uniref:C3H1-type domain-containing protein n=1 Tax=Parastrongyloides trichosuri TaxID=131310 RepID=A0A0N4ZZM4_PARTI
MFRLLAHTNSMERKGKKLTPTKNHEHYKKLRKSENQKQSVCKQLGTHLKDKEVLTGTMICSDNTESCVTFTLVDNGNKLAEVADCDSYNICKKINGEIDKNFIETIKKFFLSRLPIIYNGNEISKDGQGNKKFTEWFEKTFPLDKVKKMTSNFKCCNDGDHCNIKHIYEYKTNGTIRQSLYGYLNAIFLLIVVLPFQFVLC